MAENHKNKSKKFAYATSKYVWVKQFLNANEKWDETKVESRARALAELYYDKILHL